MAEARTKGWLFQGHAEPDEQRDHPLVGITPSALQGLVFSIVLTALPRVWAFAAYLTTVYTGHRLD